MGTEPSPHRRVLLIHNFMSPYRIGLFTELARRFDLEVWILGDIRELREWTGEAPDGAFRWRKLPHRGLGVGSRYARIVVNPTLPRELNRGGWDAVIACGWDTPAVWYAAWWTARNRIPFILWSGSTASESGWLRTLTLPIVRWVVSKARAWIAYGTRAAAYLHQLGADPARTCIAYNTVDLDVVRTASQLNPEQRDALRGALGIDTPYVLLFCGNLLALKGLHDLLPAFAELCRSRDDVTLLLVGSGKDEAGLRDRAQALGIDQRIRWTGYTEPHQVPQYFGIADLSVLPSLSEVWGLVVNESLAAGVPVVVSAAAGASDDLIADGENGFVVPPHDPAALVQAFQRYFGAPDSHAAMKACARNSVAPFTLAAMADAFEEAVAVAFANPQ